MFVISHYLHDVFLVGFDAEQAEVATNTHNLGGNETQIEPNQEMQEESIQTNREHLLLSKNKGYF